MKETAIPREEDYCDWCNGFGSSLKDPIGVDTCTRCGGTGLKRKVGTSEVSAK